jgi:hypothetical protein
MEFHTEKTERNGKEYENEDISGCTTISMLKSLEILLPFKNKRS